MADDPPEGRSPKSLGSLPKGDELSLLDRVIKESMRLLPASAYSQRINTEAVQLGPLHLPRARASFLRRWSRTTCRTCIRSRSSSCRTAGSTCGRARTPIIRSARGRGCASAGRWRRRSFASRCERILSRYRLSVVPGSDISVHVESTMLFPTNPVPMEIHAAGWQLRQQPGCRQYP